MPSVWHATERARQARRSANPFAFGGGQHVLDIVNRQSMFLNVLDVAARFFIPDDLSPQGWFLLGTMRL
jgi:hypothetical protein